MISLILQPYSRLDFKAPTLFQTSYFQCRNFITIAAQHTIQSYFLQSYFRVSIPKKEPWVKKTHLNPDHFSGKLNPTLDQNYLVFTAYPRLNCLKTTPSTAAHTLIAYIRGYPWGFRCSLFNHHEIYNNCTLAS